MSTANLRTLLSPFFDTKTGKKYVKRIVSRKKFVVIDLDKIEEWDANQAHQIINEAVKYGIGAFEKAFANAVHIVKPSLDFSKIEIGFKGKCIPFVKCHEIASEHIGKLVKVRGLVNRTHFIKPMASSVVFKCRDCGALTHEIEQDNPFALSIPTEKCDSCDACKQYDVVAELSKYIDSQEFSIQESHEDVSGRIPQRIKMMIFKKYLINRVYCGDFVELVGVVRLAPTYQRRRKSRFTIPYIEVYSMKKHSKDPEAIEINQKEEAEILELSRQSDVYTVLVDNVAPSLYGMENCKEACLLSMFGGVTKDRGDIITRGNIHVMFVGDPATAKSQLLRSVADLSPRGMFSSGRGTTAAGLTASLNKDEHGEWVIDAGVLVLADKGVACIDEIDKMRSEDRINIHEAMAQQTVTINKAGRHATLMARTAVIAAANPLFGRYDSSKSVFENLTKFPPTLFSRFDLIFILIDKPEDAHDEKVILRIEGGKTRKDIISRSLLRKYIAYAKKIMPVVTSSAKERLREYFLSIRKEMSNGKKEETIPITYRQYEGLIRLCEARARALLKDKADAEDAEGVIDLFNRFLKDIEFDVDALESGKPKSFRKARELVYEIIKSLQNGLYRDSGVPYSAIMSEGRHKGISEEKIRKAVASMIGEGSMIEHSSGHYRTAA